MFQVETGVAKLNTVTIVSAVEPHLVTTVSNCNVKGGAVGVSTLVTNGLMAGGQRNLEVGPQLHYENEVGSQREDFLTFSPDEQHPLLKREQIQAQSTAAGQPHHCVAPTAPGSPGSNSNNNNSNRSAMELDFKQPGSDLQHDLSTIHQLQAKPHMSRQNAAKSSRPLWPLEENVLLSSQEENMMSNQIQEAQAPERQASPPLEAPLLISSLVLGEDPLDGSALPSQTSVPPPGVPHSQSLKSRVQEASGKLALEDFTLDLNTDRVDLREHSALQLTAQPSSALVIQASASLRSQRGVAKPKRPERPSSLDLSSSCLHSGNICIIYAPSLTDFDLFLPGIFSSNSLFFLFFPPLTSSDDDPLTGSVSSSGEKIKRRVKTPYTLKKWRPASLVVSAEAAQVLDLEFEHRDQTLVSSGTPVRFSSGLHNQSKSSMAVFLVGIGVTATTTSEPDGMTSF